MIEGVRRELRYAFRVLRSGDAVDDPLAVDAKDRRRYVLAARSLQLNYGYVEALEGPPPEVPITWEGMADSSPEAYLDKTLADYRFVEAEEEEGRGTENP
jgi:hypothetical protein